MKYLFVTLLIIPILTFSQLPEDIIGQSCFGTNEEEIADDIIETEYAYYILSSTQTEIDSLSNDWHFDIFLTKIQKNGALIWQKKYGGTSDDFPRTLTKDVEENIYIGAGTYSQDGDVQSGIMGGEDAWVIKIDTAGTIIWEKTYGGSRDDYSAKLLYLENGNILLYTATSSYDFDVNINYGYLDIWIAEITPDGVIVQSKVFGSTFPDNIFSLIQTNDGGFFTAARAGTHDGMVDGIPRGGDDVWLLKLDNQFNIEWQKLIGGSNYDAGGIGLAQLEDGGYIFNGTTQSHDMDVHGFDFPDILNQDDNWIVRLDSEGNIIWDIALGGNNYEFSSKIFPNEDGTFTVFGTTKSMNNGDVEGHHYHQSNPNYPNDDIWMVHLSEDGEILDQRCFGNTGNDKIYRGVIKKSDFHYLLAGTAWSLPEDTIGDVNGGYESDSYDIWFFEIVDCDYFQPEIPANIDGEDSVCTLNTTTSTYTTQIINPQYEQVEWQMLPVEAGELTNLQDSVIIQWNTDYEGQVELMVRSTSNCGASAYTEPFIITINPKAEIPANIMGQDTVCTIHTSKNTYITQIANPQYEEAQWQMLPVEAGELTNLQDTAIIQWNSSFEGQVTLSVRSTSNCGESEYTQSKIIEVRSCVGIDEISKNQLKTYPNPANTQITFELPVITQESILQIKDVYGKVVGELHLIRAQTQIIWNCSNIASGVYFYQTKINWKVYRGKIVIN